MHVPTVIPQSQVYLMSGRMSTKQACNKHWDYTSQDYVLRDTFPSNNMITILDRWIVYKVLCCHRSRDCRMAHLFSSDNLIPTYHISYIRKFQLGEMEIDIWVLGEYIHMWILEQFNVCHDSLKSQLGEKKTTSKMVLTKTYYEF